MPLPKIATPTYELVLPSSNKKIKYRPFLVKEEKILILAMESQDSTQIANAVKDVISNCILSRGIKVEKLSTFDIEYLFLNIRGKSVGEDIEVMVTCPDDGKTQVPKSINIPPRFICAFAILGSSCSALRVDNSASYNFPNSFNIPPRFE